jgi:hypothetical protein
MNINVMLNYLCRNNYHFGYQIVDFGLICNLLIRNQKSAIRNNFSNYFLLKFNFDSAICKNIKLIYFLNG